MLTARDVHVPSSPLTNARLDLTIHDRQLDGRFTAASASPPRVPLNDIAANISVTPAGVIEITGANAKMFTGSVGGDVRVEFVNGEPRYTFAIDAKNLEANDFLSHLTPAKDFLYGNLEFNGKFEGAGLTAQEAVSKLKANGSAFAVDGQMKLNSVLGEIASLLGVPELREVNFRSLQSGFHIENGWLSFDGFDLIEPDAKWHLDGKMAFDGTLDYNANIILSKALADRALVKLGDAARFLVTDKGELPLDLKIAGTVTKPKVSVDMSGVAGRAREAGASRGRARGRRANRSRREGDHEPREPAQGSRIDRRPDRWGARREEEAEARGAACSAPRDDGGSNAQASAGRAEHERRRASEDRAARYDPEGTGAFTGAARHLAPGLLEGSRRHGARGHDEASAALNRGSRAS